MVLHLKRHSRLALFLALALPGFVHADEKPTPPSQILPVETAGSIYNDQSSSLSGITPKAVQASLVEDDDKSRPLPLLDSQGRVADNVAQTTPATSLALTTAGLGFNGVGQGFTGPGGTFSVDSAPPDPTGAVGATQYVQWVNSSFAVFDKTTGVAVYGPAAGNTLWAGFGGPCETSNDGDPIVQYDKLADRWVMMQFAVPDGGPYYQCVAISKTSDATGEYWRYAFQYSGFNDYPKVGVWPDAYYVTFNMFSGSSYSGPKVCAYDRVKMLAGQAATQQCIQLSSSYGSVLPADLDGTTAPPAGSPNYMFSKGTSSLLMWKFHVDWNTPGLSTLTGPTTIKVAAYNAACKGGTCIPQPNTRQKLDSLADRLMYRLAYRNFGDHESLVVTHAVRAGTLSSSPSGIRWYEIRNPSGVPVVYQQATYAPDAAFRWMSSMAMDKMGNIAVGYSVSSTKVKPSIRYATHAASAALNVLSNEQVIMAGTGSQTGNLNRWGDYSHMSVDPVDDCTFWYTNEYIPSNGSFNWSTRIASFKINGCS